MSTFRHNKKRNVGLVYEFLIRKMCSQLLEKDQRGYEKSCKIARKYFSPGTVLGAEHDLFLTIRKSRGLREPVARRILSLVKEHAQKIDRKSSEIRKNNLIKELNYTFGKDFFSEQRVPEYRLLASISLYLDPDMGTLSEGVQKTQLEDALIRFMTTSDPAGSVQRDEKKVDNLACAIAAKNFQEQYRGVLNGDQKRLIEKYMVLSVSGDENGTLSRFLSSEVQRIRNLLQESSQMKEFKDDPVMKQRLTEARDHLDNDVTTMNLETKVQEIMLYYKLAEELASHD